MKLGTYLSTNSIAHSHFGKRVGVSHVHIGRLVRGERKPSIDLVERIFRETDGAVTANDFFDGTTAQLDDRPAA